MASCNHDWEFALEANPKTKRETEIATCKVCRWRRLASQVRRGIEEKSPNIAIKRELVKKDYGYGNLKKTYRVLMSPKPGPFRRCIG